eukprot:6090695-Prymnesium_polylepis.1
MPAEARRRGRPAPQQLRAAPSVRQQQQQQSVYVVDATSREHSMSPKSRLPEFRTRHGLSREHGFTALVPSAVAVADNVRRHYASRRR